MSLLEYAENIIREDNTYSTTKDVHNYCHFCSYKAKSFFVKWNRVRRHQLQHKSFCCEKHAPEIYHCKECDFKTYLLIIFQKHIQQVHLTRSENASEMVEYTLPSIVCQKCTFETYSSLQWLKHVKTGCVSTGKKQEESGGQKIPCKDSQGWYVCKHCSYKTKNKKVLSTHVVRTHKENSFECDHCGFKTHLKMYLRRHVFKWHTPSENFLYDCDRCSFKGMSMAGLMRHKQNHCLVPKVIKQYQCIYCPFKTKYKPSLPRHVIFKHKRDEIDWLKCDLCEFKTKLEVHLRYHVRRKHTEWKDTDLFHCDKCSYKAKTKQSISSHNITHHLAPEEIQWFQCDKCPYKAKARASLRYHNIHQHSELSQIEIFYCDNCPYKSKNKSNLKRHSEKCPYKTNIEDENYVNYQLVSNR